jgi:hypothetical protein
MDDILFEARKRFKILYDMDRKNHDSFIENMKFSFNVDTGHWTSEDISYREEKKRPYITAHKLGKFVSQVVNTERGMPNKDLVIPVDGEGDPDIARVYNYLINDIEYKSDYDEIITMEGEYAVGGGFGFWRILTEYDEYGFNNEQNIRIKPIINPLMVHLERKGRYAFIRESLSMDEFEELYPDKKDENTSFIEQEDDELWYENEKIFIAEYFRKVPCKKTIAEIKTSNGTAIIEINEKNKNLPRLREKEINSHKIEWYKISGNSILEKTDWPGSEIPIVEVDGHKVYLEGQIYKKALTSDAKSMNRAYNYWFTALTEKVALTPKAPYIVTSSQIKGHEDEWREANVENRPYLTVNNVSAGIPQRTPAPEVGQGELLMLNLADQNIKDVLGMYETSVGMGSNERSGKAINARAARSDLGTYHFPDNLRKAKLKTKKLLIDLIPKVYDNERTIKVIGRKEAITLNKTVFDNERGEVVAVNDLSVGRYDIRASNPMNPSIRQQAVDNIREAMQYAGPEYAAILLPIMLEFIDLPGMKEATQAVKQRTQQLDQNKQAELAAKQPLNINDLMGGQ